MAQNIKYHSITVGECQEIASYRQHFESECLDLGLSEFLVCIKDFDAVDLVHLVCRMKHQKDPNDWKETIPFILRDNAN